MRALTDRIIEILKEKGPLTANDLTHELNEAAKEENVYVGTSNVVARCIKDVRRRMIRSIYQDNKTFYAAIPEKTRI
jgi:hypothetical protein